MKFPPGYGYPSVAEMETTGEQNLFERAVTFVLGVIVYGWLVYGAGVIVWGMVMGIVLTWSTSAQSRDLGQWQDDDLASWYRSLMQPDAPNTSCCGEADAYWADEVHVRDGKTYATITDDRDDAPRGRPHVPVGTEIEIPNHKLKWDRSNPTGHGIVFMSRSRFVFCYVQPGGV